MSPAAATGCCAVCSRRLRAACRSRPCPICSGRIRCRPAFGKRRAVRRDARLARQHAEGYWLFELEADCTIPAEYIMMMHFLHEIDAALEVKLCRYLRAAQADHGGWPLYHGGGFNFSCTGKYYYALKLSGDS